MESGDQKKGLDSLLEDFSEGIIKLEERMEGLGAAVLATYLEQLGRLCEGAERESDATVREFMGSLKNIRLHFR